MKLCVYTCITGSYDYIKEIEFKEKNIDYYCFTNNKNLKSNTWNIIYINDEDLDNIKLARKIKILGHEILEKYDYSVWLDGSIIMRRKISDFIKDLDLEKYDLIGFKHSLRNCIYDECKYVVKYKKEKKENAIKIEKFLEKEKYPKHNGLIESTVLVRKINSKIVKETCKLWFDMILNYSSRDQLSFNYAAYKTGLKFKLLNLNVFDNKYFTASVHDIKKDITNYRLYFSDNDDLENYSYDLDVQGKYKIKNNEYSIDLIVPADSNKVIFEICKTGGIKFNSIKINGKNINYELVNGFNYNNYNLFTSYDPKVYLINNFKKGTKINISMNIDILIDLDLYNIINDLNHNNNLLNVKINELQVENRKLKHNPFYSLFLLIKKIINK